MVRATIQQSESEGNSTTGVRALLPWFHSPAQGLLEFIEKEKNLRTDFKKILLNLFMSFYHPPFH